MEGIVGFKFQHSHSCCGVRVRVGFPARRCPNGFRALADKPLVPVTNPSPSFLRFFPAIMALAPAGSCHVADIDWIYSDVPGDYALCELCIMSRFRPITPEDKGGIGAIV